MADIPFTNPTPSFSSNNPAGTGNTLNYIGNYAFAYSGLVSVGSTAITVLRFETGTQLLVAKYVLNYASNLAHGEDYLWQVKMNDEIVMQTVIEGAKVTTPPRWMPLIIPPFTKMEFVADNIENSEVRSQAVLVTAEVPYA
jgi:hypothetical protein